MTSNPSGALKKTFSSAFSLFLSERKEKKNRARKKKADGGKEPKEKISRKDRTWRVGENYYSELNQARSSPGNNALIRFNSPATKKKIIIKKKQDVERDQQRSLKLDSDLSIFQFSSRQNKHTQISRIYALIF